jgi:hypothetical protein
MAPEQSAQVRRQTVQVWRSQALFRSAVTLSTEQGVE